MYLTAVPGRKRRSNCG